MRARDAIFCAEVFDWAMFYCGEIPTKKSGHEGPDSNAFRNEVEALRCRQREWLVANGFLDEATANAAGANFHTLGSAIRKRHADSLEVGPELATGLAGNLRTDTAEILRFTASLDGVPHLRALATNFTNASHDVSRYKNFLNLVEIRRGIIAVHL